MADDQVAKSTGARREMSGNVDSELTQRTTRHLYQEVNLFHSQAHLGDSIQNNTYHTHHYHQNSAKQIKQPDPPTLTEFEDLEKVALFVFLLLCAHTSASLMHLPPCVGVITWNRHVGIPLRIRIGASASILKHGGLLGLSVWDVNRNDGALLKRYSDHFVLSWLVLTSLNLPRTMKILDTMDANGQFFMGMIALLHLLGEIIEHVICLVYLKGRLELLQGTE